MADKWTYDFKGDDGGSRAEGNAFPHLLLGQKGANLAELTSLGLPVPCGFTISTLACNSFYENKKSLSDVFKNEILASLKKLETQTVRKFGALEKSLFISVRSGAATAMTGLVGSVLNLGMNDKTVEAFTNETGDKRFALDSYRRFIQMYGAIILDVDHSDFEDVLDTIKSTKNYKSDTQLDAADWQQVIEKYKALIVEETEEAFPQDPMEQLFGAIEAIYISWNSVRAKMYRTINNTSETYGAAISVQEMVFGNRGIASAVGTAFTRHPLSGENKLHGEFLQNSQGDDAAAGIRTSHSISVKGLDEARAKTTYETQMPKAFAELKKTADVLEKHFQDLQKIEFVVEEGNFWILQSGSAKRSTSAALKIAVDMVEEGKITKEEAVASIDASSLVELLHPTIAKGVERDILTTGLAASPGAATGKVVFSSRDAEALKAAGEHVILVRTETSPEDIHGMNVAQGVLTQRGGMTSHAAVIARGMGIPCVSGANELRINLENEELRVAGRIVKKGEVITLDGSLGQVLAGGVEMDHRKLSGAFGVLMSWADDIRRMEVRSNAEMPKDAQLAYSFGAQGIGLCRTEHMFFEGERIVAVREMILATDEEGRRNALAKLLPMQRKDFVELFDIMAGRPVNIRLLDPPLHEFLPSTEVDMDRVATAMGISLAQLKRRAADLKEVNPMLGLRGCRLAISYPEIAEMQARAIFEAAAEVSKNSGSIGDIEIMVPLISLRAEYEFVHNTIAKIADEVMAETGTVVNYKMGTMIELPRAALRAAELALSADFFSFGTNDLTQTTFGISRDDAPQFLQKYQLNNIIERDPFSQIDEKGVGDLMNIAMERGRGAKPELKFGACGEHAGDPKSIDFFESIGMDYISCSPYRVPIARLAAAQATLKFAK